MRKRVLSYFRKIFKILFWSIICSGLLYLFWLPYVPKLKKINPATTALIELRKKQALKKGRNLEPKIRWKKIEEISPTLVRAVLLAEDDTFYQHRGFDFEQIKIAVEMNWKKKKFFYGGSTITQQFARTLYLSPSKNLLRKIKEAMITFWMEQTLSKKRILEIYLNVVEWGDGIYGAEAAARHYYNKSCADLTPEESVALASILPSPRKWSPFKETPFMHYRRTNLLSRMQMEQWIVAPATETEAAREKVAEELPEEENGNGKEFETTVSSP